eukprot:4613946-Karenia_brevis.AAC.1
MRSRTDSRCWRSGLVRPTTATDLHSWLIGKDVTLFNMCTRYEEILHHPQNHITTTTSAILIITVIISRTRVHEQKHI